MTSLNNILINDGCFGFSNMGSIYHLNEDGIILLSFLSILISIILHKFYNKTDFKILYDNQIEIVELKKYSLTTKTLAIFFILVLVSVPIFKLLNTGYFL